MKDARKEFEIIISLNEFLENSIRIRLKKNNPNISEDEILKAIHKLYQVRPGAEHGDADLKFFRPRKLNND